MKEKQKPVKIKISRSGPFVHPFTECWKAGDDFEIHAWHLFTDKNLHAMMFAVREHRFEIYFYKSGRQIYVIPCQEKKKKEKQ